MTRPALSASRVATWRASCWAPACDRGHKGPERQARGGQRGRGQQHPRIAEGLTETHALVVHDVVPDQQPVPASLFGGLGHGRDRASIGEVPEVGDVDGEPHRAMIAGLGQDLAITRSRRWEGLVQPVIALVGALLPAGWAAQSRTAAALRTE